MPRAVAILFASYNQSPLIDILATNSAPQVINSAIAIRLVAYHRNPFMRQIQNPHEIRDPYVTASKHSSAALLAEWGTWGLITGFRPSTPAKIAAAKKSR